MAPEAVDPPAPPLPPAPPVGARKEVRITLSDDRRGTRVFVPGEAERSIILKHFAEGRWPELHDENCGSGERPVVEHRKKGARELIVICRDRIELVTKRAREQADRAAEVAMNSRDIERSARRAALDGVRQARAAILANTAMSEAQRAEALRGIDTAIAELSSGRD